MCAAHSPLAMEAPVRRIVDSIMREGVAHHYSVVWEAMVDDMAAIAQILGIEVIHF